MLLIILLVVIIVMVGYKMFKEQENFWNNLLVYKDTEDDYEDVDKHV